MLYGVDSIAYDVAVAGADCVLKAMECLELAASRSKPPVENSPSFSPYWEQFAVKKEAIEQGTVDIVSRYERRSVKLILRCRDHSITIFLCRYGSCRCPYGSIPPEPVDFVVAIFRVERLLPWLVNDVVNIFDGIDVPQ